MGSVGSLRQPTGQAASHRAHLLQARSRGHRLRRRAGVGGRGDGGAGEAARRCRVRGPGPDHAPPVGPAVLRVRRRRFAPGRAQGGGEPPVGAARRRSRSTSSRRFWRSRMPGSGSTKASTSGACSGRSGPTSNRAASAGRIDDHPAADQARRAGQRADARPQDRRSRAGVATREDDDQGGDPRPLRQHRLLRQPRVRDPGRRRDVLRRQCPRPQPRAGRPVGGAHPQPRLVQPHPVPGAGSRAARRRPRAHGRRRGADRGRGGRMEAGHADPDRRAQRVAPGQRLLRIPGGAAAAGRQAAGQHPGGALQRRLLRRAQGLHDLFAPGAGPGSGGARSEPAARQRRVRRRYRPGRQAPLRLGGGRVGRPEDRGRPVHGRRARLPELQVQPGHPEQAADRVVVQDLRARHRHGAAATRPRTRSTEPGRACSRIRRERPIPTRRRTSEAAPVGPGPSRPRRWARSTARTCGSG